MSDNLTSIALGGINRHAEWLILSSREISHYMALLRAQPEWETMAMDAMLRADKALEAAHSALREEILAFQRLPVEK